MREEARTILTCGPLFRIDEKQEVSGLGPDTSVLML